MYIMTAIHVWFFKVVGKTEIDSDLEHKFVSSVGQDGGVGEPVWLNYDSDVIQLRQRFSL